MNSIYLILMIWIIWFSSAGLIYLLILSIGYLTTNCKIGMLFNLSSFWIGVHYSCFFKKYCINLIPCVTIWIVLPQNKSNLKVT